MQLPTCRPKWWQKKALLWQQKALLWFPLMTQSQFPWHLAYESKSGDVACGQQSVIIVKNRPGRSSTGHLEVACRCLSKKFRLFFLKKGSHLQGIHRVSTGHLQGTWPWPADPSPRLIPCKNRAMSKNLQLWFKSGRPVPMPLWCV